MTGLLLELRARRLTQLLIWSTAAGIAGASAGMRLAPVPGELFADVDGVPVVILTPVLVAVSAARWAPVGTWWVDDTDRCRIPQVVMILCAVVATVPALAASGAAEPALVGARNTLLLLGLALTVRARSGEAASAAAVLVPSFAVWTFGWDALGEPQPWALLLAGPADPVALGLAAALLTTGLASTRTKHT